MEYISPKFSTGYANNSKESLFPNLWKNLWGYWSPGMGQQGSYLYDFSGKQGLASFTTTNPPTWVNSPSYNGPSIQFPSGMATNGSCKGVILNSPDSYFPKSNFGYTFSCWFTVASGHSGKIQFLLISGSNGLDSSGDLYLFYNDSTSQFNFGGVFNGTSEWDFSPTGFTTSSIYNGKWHLLTVVCDPLNSTTTAYLDSQVIGTTTGTFQYTQVSPQQVWLGSPGNVGSGPWTCGDVGLWYRPLSKDEIASLYNGSSPLQFLNPDGWLFNPEMLGSSIVTPSTLTLTSTLYVPSLVISSLIEPLNFSLISTLYSPTISSFTSVNPSTFNLTSTLYSPSLLISSLVHPSLLTLTATLHQPTIIAPGTNELSFASAIISYNPLIIVSNTNPVKVSIVDVSTPDNPIYTSYSYAGCSNATAVSYNSDLGMIYVSCADGIILEINASSPTSYTLNYTGSSGNLTSLTILSDFFDIYAGTDYSTGEAVNMYEGSATTVACDVRFNASYQKILGTQINTINAQMLSTDIRFVGIVNNTVGCDIRFISSSYADLSITPIARPDFVVYIGGIEVPDVKLDSIEIVHTADEKSQATFTLSRKHDNVNYVLNPDNTQGTYIPVLGHPTVQITIQGQPEFGYDTPAYVWDVDCKSENEQVKIVAYSELPKQDERSTVTLSIPLVNEKLHVYHALVNNPVIDNPVILPDDINPPFYLGILIDNGYTRIENITQFIGFSTISQDESQFVNYVFGSGDSGVYDINGNDIYFKPLQNWTYFWFGHATNFITGQTWTGLLNNGSSYLGTSPSSLTTTTWNVDYINFWYQREFPNSVYRGSPQNVGSAIVYPSDFLGIVPFPYNPDPYDNIVNINPFNGHTTIDQVLRDHTPMTFTGADILNAKTRLAVFVSPGSTLTTINGINYLITLEGDLTPVQLNMSTKILDLIDSKFGITFGDAPYKKVSAKSGILTTVTKWEDAPNGLFYHKQQGYNYVNYTNSVGEIEFEKIQNINGSVLPKTKCDIEQFIDGYYYYNIQLLKRINIDQTTQPNIYDGNNGFPVSVKSIHISSKDMKVTLDCSNAWSRLELLELEGKIPDPYYSLIPEVLTEYSPKFDPNTLNNIT